MAVGYSTNLRNARLNEITAAVDAGTAAGKLRLYNGTRPSTGGAATTLVSEHTMSDPSFSAAVGGTLTAGAISQVNAVATTPITWWRLVDSNDTFIMDGDAGLAGAELILDDVNAVTGQPVTINSFVITAGNA